ncbi:MAG: tail fiber domain-containing protein [Dokdonella sp.]|nr:MAG: tail fiber domain-containing protein [Dokdonella sp.]
MTPTLMRAALAAALGLAMAAPAAATGFTYHGQLQEAGQPANGSYDLQLTLYSAPAGGSVLAGPVTLYGVTVKDGNFATTVDFGTDTALTQQGWLEVKLKSGTADFTALANRSPVAPEGSACPGSWTLDGNAGNPAGSYLGTADNNPVWLRSNGVTAAYFGPNHSVGLAFPYVPLADYSTAIGYNARTENAGSIVTGGYNDNTFGTTIRDTATNQVVLVAEHGVGINTARAPDNNPLRDELTIAPSTGLPGSSADITLMTGTPGTTGYRGFNVNASSGGFLNISGLYYTSGDPIPSYDPVFAISHYHSATTGRFSFNGGGFANPISVGTTPTNGNGAFLSSTGVWTNASSRSFKDSFAAIDPVAILDKLVALPIQSWYYKGNRDDGMHLGPVAEEFASAFGLGSNAKYIGTVDESGVALAAIQGLHRKVEQENARLQRDNAQLRGRLDALASRLEVLESTRRP